MFIKENNMEYVEITLIGGDHLCIRKEAIVVVREFKFITKELIKENPFLKGCSGCTAIMLADRQTIYCEDPYCSIIEMLK